MAQWEQELSVARAAALRAGELALAHQRAGVSPETKPDLSPVTIADKEAERAIVAEISAAFPQDGFLGEEGSSSDGPSGRRWIIDPIDGTRDFLRSVPHWAVLIGLEAEGRVVAGVAYFPALRRLYQAARGSGASCDDRPIRVSRIASPADATLCVNGINALHRSPLASRVLEWTAQFGAVRSFGGCMDAVLLASGNVDVWVEPTAQPWDVAALQVILEEAGARVFSFEGEATIYGSNCIACVPALEPIVRQLFE
jgi:histidinol phosphatase-like enzyme (inositol monophosphatase family)